MATIPNLTGFDAGLPANIDAEKTILGAILLDNAAHSEASERIDADDFSLDSHRRIFLRMTDLMDSVCIDCIPSAASQEGPAACEEPGSILETAENFFLVEHRCFEAHER